MSEPVHLKASPSSGARSALFGAFHCSGQYLVFEKSPVDFVVHKRNVHTNYATRPMFRVTQLQSFPSRLPVDPREIHELSSVCGYWQLSRRSKGSLPARSVALLRR